MTNKPDDVLVFDLGNGGEMCAKRSYIDSLSKNELRSLLAWKKAWYSLASLPNRRKWGKQDENGANKDR